MLAPLRAAATPRPSLVLARNEARIATIAKRHEALDIKVFGSVVRGEDKPGSDIDLLVRFAPGASIFDQVDLEQDLEDLLGVGVDVVSEAGLRSGHDRIMQEARPLLTARSTERRGPSRTSLSSLTREHDSSLAGNQVVAAPNPWQPRPQP